ncbi:MAG TPA: DUF6351 family protein, partial [Candidatus Binataceae bacterium]|nr:DUF6351 family protein [Candidatus Binataceae bacterium]
LNGSGDCRGGVDVSARFRRGTIPGSLVGLIRGLRDGTNTIAACLRFSGAAGASRTLTVHSPGGPVFSGPAQTPFFCELESPVTNPRTGQAIVNPFTHQILDGFLDPVTGKPVRGVDAVNGRAANLAPAMSPNPTCAADTIVSYYYMSSRYGRGLQPLETPSNRAQWPRDIAMTRTSRGRMVPFIVRVQTGTANRGIYQIAILHDPSSDPPPDPFHPPAGWNGRLIYTFGGNCVGGNHQGASTGGVLNELWSDNIRGPAHPAFSDNPSLAQGYAVASSTLDVLGNDCNDVIAAETMMMVKERFIDDYGVPVHTIGWGLSGGTMLQQLIAQDYPGLLDGLILGMSFPDLVTMVEPITDCSLLNRAFDAISRNYRSDPKHNPPPLTGPQTDAVSGFHSWETCKRWMGDYPYGLQTDFNSPHNTAVGYSPSVLLPGACDLSLPPEFAWPHSGGVRCDLFDNMANIYGLRNGIARRAVDNVGVQYGLAAYNAGLIGWAQFIAINRLAGGYDANGNIVASRTAADEAAVKIAYQSGRVSTGGAPRDHAHGNTKPAKIPDGLAKLPIIALQVYGDAVDEIHSRYGPFMARARLVAAYGNARGYLDKDGNPKNQIILTGPMPPKGNSMNGDFFFGEFFDNAGRLGGINVISLMDRWLDQIGADRAGIPEYLKVADDKPATLTDGCFYQDHAGAWRESKEPALYNGLERYNRGEAKNCNRCSPECASRCKCNELYPSFANPRLAAGGGGAGPAPPLTNDILKCTLKPIDARDYRGGLTVDQRRQLQAVFPSGVCDWERPGQYQQPPWGTWLAFPSPGKGVSLNSQ